MLVDRKGVVRVSVYTCWKRNAYVFNTDDGNIVSEMRICYFIGIFCDRSFIYLRLYTYFTLNFFLGFSRCKTKLVQCENADEAGLWRIRFLSGTRWPWRWRCLSLLGPDGRSCCCVSRQTIIFNLPGGDGRVICQRHVEKTTKSERERERRGEVQNRRNGVVSEQQFILKKTFHPAQTTWLRTAVCRRPTLIYRRRRVRTCARGPPAFRLNSPRSPRAPIPVGETTYALPEISLVRPVAYITSG